MEEVYGSCMYGGNCLLPDAATNDYGHILNYQCRFIDDILPPWNEVPRYVVAHWCAMVRKSECVWLNSHYPWRGASTDRHAKSNGQRLALRYCIPCV